MAANFGAALWLHDPIKPTKPTNQGMRPTTSEQPTTPNLGAAVRLHDPMKPTKPTKQGVRSTTSERPTARFSTRP